MPLLHPRARRAARSGLLAIALVGVVAADASAAGRPIVSVPAAPAYVSPGVYRLSAKVSANGLWTTATIQYGATTSYGRNATTETILGGSRTFSRVTAAMPIGSTVHYRVRANNLFGTTFGPDQTYVVEAAGGIDAPVVSTGGRPEAVPDASRAFLLYGTVGSKALASTTRIEFGPTQSYGTSTAASPVAAGSTSKVSIRVAAPAPGTTINYRTVASNASGTTYGPNQQFKVPGGVVRPVYMYPTDRPFRQRYQDLIDEAMGTIQAFYAAQVGTTFTVASEPVVCAMPNTNAFYGTEQQNSSGAWIGAWQKLDAALSACPGVTRNDGGYSDLVVYADVHSLSCNDRIGAATTNLTFMGDNDLQGLDGVTGFTNAPCGPGNDTRTGPWGYTGGAAHELGHTFGLPHPDDILATCPSPSPYTPECQRAYDSLMYVGYIDLRTTYLLERDKVKVRSSPFFS